MKVITNSLDNNLPHLPYYTGVGSRDTPKPILYIMEKLAIKLSGTYILRSGGAPGADSAFQKGAKNAVIYYADDATPEAIAIAKDFHPAWHRCSERAQKLHGRNAFQVLGHDLKTPSKFLICWTPDGAVSDVERSIKTGGTGTAVSIASAFGVPVYNLQQYDHFMLAYKWIGEKPC